MTLDRGQAFDHILCSFACEIRPLERDSLLHRSGHALDGYQKRHSMFIFVFVPGTAPNDHGPLLRDTLARVLYLLHKRANAFPLDTGFEECDLALDDINTQQKIHSGEQVERLRSVDTTCIQRGNACSTGSGRCDHSASSP